MVHGGKSFDKKPASEEPCDVPHVLIKLIEAVRLATRLATPDQRRIINARAAELIAVYEAGEAVNIAVDLERSHLFGVEGRRLQA